MTSACANSEEDQELWQWISLRKAQMYFGRRAYDGTSLSDLTEAMGINKPSLYAHLMGQ